LHPSPSFGGGGSRVSPAPGGAHRGPTSHLSGVRTARASSMVSVGGSGYSVGPMALPRTLTLMSACSASAPGGRYDTEAAWEKGSRLSSAMTTPRAGAGPTAAGSIIPAAAAALTHRTHAGVPTSSTATSSTAAATAAAVAALANRPSAPMSLPAVGGGAGFQPRGAGQVPLPALQMQAQPPRVGLSATGAPLKGGNSTAAVGANAGQRGGVVAAADACSITPPSGSPRPGHQQSSQLATAFHNIAQGAD
jgi:hypothetical protein